MSGPDRQVNDREDGRPVLEVACLHPDSQRAELVSTTGSHCQVWRSTQKLSTAATDCPDAAYVDYVIKHPRDRYDATDARILARQYRELRGALGDIVPEAVFVVGPVDGEANLLVIARAVDIWFNIANPSNREEAIGLLRNHPLARDQLRVFLAQARAWREGANPRIIDLYGLDNLVMDNRRHIRYVDSYYVFFFEDMLHLLGGERDYELEEKIRLSLQRLDYLAEILAVADRQPAAGS
jgi:hypothetical protein